jgi:exopolysaccharide biosynthesis polyprenyl glycosylphosphotransferase
MLIFFGISDFIFLTGFRGLMYVMLGRTGFWQSRPERVLIVGTGDIARSVAEKMMAKSDPGLLLTGFAAENGDTDAPVGSIPVLGNMTDTPAIVDTESIDHIIFALSPNEHRSLKEIILRLYDRPVRIFVVPDVLELAFFRVSMQEWHGIPILGLKEPVITGFARVEKRLFDLIVAAGMLLLLWPVMLVTALAVRLDTPGPIILKQARVGENGSIFTLYKFRSMTQDADRQPVDARQGHKQRGDPRVTRVGRFIRRTSIDELPQLFNVMKGDMSMVGPRPELPAIVENYEPWQYKRFAVPPGITGWWQISGRSDRPMHLHTEDDLYYISHYSPLLDIQILLKTIWVVIKGEGAY